MHFAVWSWHFCSSALAGFTQPGSSPPGSIAVVPVQVDVPPSQPSQYVRALIVPSSSVSHALVMLPRFTHGHFALTTVVFFVVNELVAVLSHVSSSNGGCPLAIASA